jgi:hypothetical protein
MKKRLIIGQYERIVNESTKAKALGDLIVEASDIAVDDWKNQIHKVTKTPLTSPRTLNQIRARCGSSKLTLVHPINQQPFTLDLSPWDKIDGERYFRIDMGWVRRTT